MALVSKWTSSSDTKMMHVLSYSGRASGVSRMLRRGVTTSMGGSGPLCWGVTAGLDSVALELASTACIDIVFCGHQRISVWGKRHSWCARYYKLWSN